jgi:hypothetical protein
MTIGEAISVLQDRWGEIHVSVRSGVATVANISPLKRQSSDPRHGPIRVHERASLAEALAVALHAEGLAS